MYKKLVVSLWFLSILYTSSFSADTLNKPKNHTFGIEVNPLGVLYSIATAGGYISGGVSYFNYDYGLEVTLPVTLNYGFVDRSVKDYSNEQDNYDEIDLNVDIHLRKYLDSNIGGLYFGAFTRYTYLEGKVKNDYRFAKVHKVGIGAEIGYKIMGLFYKSPLYVGTSIGVGRYFGADNDMFEAKYYPMHLDDSQYFITFEVFKIGYEF